MTGRGEMPEYGFLVELEARADKQNEVERFLADAQALVNDGPRPRPQTRDLLDTVGSAQAWSESAMQQWAERTGGVYRKTRLRKADVQELRHLRAGIASALRRRDGMEHPAPKTSTPLARVGISAVIGADAG